MKKLKWSQFGIMNMNYLFYTFDYFLDAAHTMGVPNINLWAANPHLLLEKANEEDFRSINKKIKDRDLKCFCVCPEQIVYPFNIAAQDKYVRHRSIDIMKRAVDLCVAVESPLLHICPGWGFYDKPDGIKTAWELARSAIIDISYTAEQQGITVVLEPLQIVESNLVVDVASAKQMMDEVNRPNFKLMVDTCHMAVKGETLDDYFNVFGDNIVHIHLNESGQVPWGYGNLPLGTYIHQLEQHEFSGSVTLEVCARSHYINPNETMAKGVQTVRNAIV